MTGFQIFLKKLNIEKGTVALAESNLSKTS